MQYHLEMSQLFGKGLLRRWLDKWTAGDHLSRVGFKQSDRQKDLMLPVGKSNFYGSQSIKSQNIFSTEESLQCTEI